MPLTIDWTTEASGEKSHISLPVFGAELSIALVGDVIVDASWQLSVENCKPLGLALQVQRYLLDPSLPLLVKCLTQGSGYSNRVWQRLLTIPMGQVVTYSALALSMGTGARAVAGACRNNPYAGLIPCHRVVGQSGIGGFMGQAKGEMVELKRRILSCERELVQN